MYLHLRTYYALMGIIMSSMYMKLLSLNKHNCVHYSFYIIIVMTLNDKVMLQLYCTACIVCVAIAYQTLAFSRRWMRLYFPLIVSLSLLHVDALHLHQTFLQELLHAVVPFNQLSLCEEEVRLK